MDPITAGALVSAGIGFLGSERANAANRKEAARNRAFQSAEAGINRGFQERMRNTEWQAAVADMQAAGINPAVAYARGGASSPGGSMAGGSQAAPATDSVSSAMAVLGMRKQLQLLDQQIAKTKSEASTAASEASIKFADQQMAMEQRGFYFGPDGRPTGPLRELLQAEHTAKMAGSARAVSDAQLSKFSVPEQEAIARLWSTVGGVGKGAGAASQVILPLILQMMRGRR